MIISEKYKDNYMKYYSNNNLKIRQIETGRIYVSAIDIYPYRFTYEETDIPIPNFKENLTSKEYE